MVNLRISWVTVKKVLKYIFSFLVILGVAYLGYLTYYFATNSPYKVRVTNVTGTSATISWYTNREDKGLVIYDQKNSFLPIIPAFGKSEGYDDRDVALAQTTLINKVTEKSVKDVNADYEVSLDSEDLTGLKITKKGNYYVHHVTLTNLSPESKYYFRVGNGIFWWNVKVDNQKIQDFEAPTLTSLEFSTYKDPENLSAPNPAFGQVLSLARNKDGYLINNPSTDAIVFLKLDSEVDSQYQSSVVNTDGGWVIDKSNFRDSSGNVFKDLKEGDAMVAHTQFENVAPMESIQLLSGVTDNPAQYIYGNTDNEAKLLGNIIDKLKFSLNESSPTLLAKFLRIGFAAEDSGLPGTGVSAPSTSTTKFPCNYLGKSFGNLTKDACNTAIQKYKNELEAKKEVDNTPEPSVPAPQPPASNSGGTSCVAQKCQIKDANGILKDDPNSVWSQSKCACIKKSVGEDGYANCKGQYASSCEPAGVGGNSTNCFCEIKDAKGNGTGSYLPLRGIDCRPASCASNRNQDNVCIGGDCNPRTKCPNGQLTCDEKEKVLCGLNDFATPGCGNPVDGKCPEGTTYYDYRKNCISPALIKKCYVKGVVENLTSEDCAEKGGTLTPPPTPPGIVDDGKGVADTDPFEVITCIINGQSVKATRVRCAQAQGLSNISQSSELANAKSISQQIAAGIACCSKSQYGDYVKQATNTEQGLSCGYGSGLYICAVGCNKTGFVRNAQGVCDCAGGKVYNPDTKLCEFVDTNNPVGVGSSLFCDKYNCGYTNKRVVENGVAKIVFNNYCGKPEYKGECAPNQFCEILTDTSDGKRGLCKDKGVQVGIEITNKVPFEDKKSNEIQLDYHYTCCQYSGSTGLEESNYKLVDDDTSWKDCKDKLGKGWKDVDINKCMDRINNPEGSYLPTNTDNKVYAQSNVDLTTQGDYVIVFPESGVVNINVDDNQKNTYVNKNNKYFLFQNRDGVSGYQEPKNPNNPEKDEDLIIKTTGRKIAVSKVAPMYKMKLNRGINIVSFNFLPTSDGKNGLKASEFIEIVNNGTNLYIKSISYFDGGKWVGGVATNTNTYEVNGNDFTLVPGVGYAIVAFKDVSTEIPGLKVQEGIPVAFSSGWNLIGVNGYSTTYTASSLIDSLNGLSGIKANNVTWWPTSKGRYESFQKSEGVEYGFDYPILNDMGYFVRISEFNPESNSTKSIIWNPGNVLNGTPGSEN